MMRKCSVLHVILKVLDEPGKHVIGKRSQAVKRYREKNNGFAV
jgi:hypothetical protein